MRRCRRTGIAAVALCLGGALTACGSTDDDGHVALGAAGSGPAPTAAVPPQGGVVLVPLDDPRAPREPGGEHRSAGPEGSRTPGASGTDVLPAVPPGGTSGAGGSTQPGQAPGGAAGQPEAPTGPGTTPRPSPTPSPKPPPPGPDVPAGPALLQLTEPVRKALDKRWCEQVTVEFRNTGGSPVTSGTVTFATHIIGALGIDWATIESAQPLPAPIAPGAVRKKAYTVCVDAWRVPLGMHIETRDVTAEWK